MLEAARAPLNEAMFDGTVLVREEPPQGMITVRGDLASAAMAQALGAVPGVNKVVSAQGTEVLWMSPDEAMVLCPYAEVGAQVARIEAALGGTHHLVADVSDARAGFTLTGEGVRDVLAKLTPADVAPAVFTPGDLRRTRLAQVAAAFWMDETRAVRIICFRSVAQYVFDILKGAADPRASLRYF